MADLLNLGRFRKARQRAEKDKEAARNRLAFGRPKAEHQLREAVLQKAARALDGHRREPGPDIDHDE